MYVFSGGLVFEVHYLLVCKFSWSNIRLYTFIEKLYWKTINSKDSFIYIHYSN